MHVGGVVQYNLRPPFEDCVGEVKFPANLREEGPLVSIDLANSQARHLAPGFGRVVAVLQVLRCQDQGGQEHATSAHERACTGTVDLLLPCEVTLGYERFDQNQIVKCDLQRRIAGARSPKRLLNVSAQWQDTTSSTAVCSARNR